jgi:hypothetical protein
MPYQNLFKENTAPKKMKRSSEYSKQSRSKKLKVSSDSESSSDDMEEGYKKCAIAVFELTGFISLVMYDGSSNKNTKENDKFKRHFKLPTSGST